MPVLKKRILVGRTPHITLADRIRKAIETGDNDALDVHLNSLDAAMPEKAPDKDEDGNDSESQGGGVHHHVNINMPGADDSDTGKMLAAHAAKLESIESTLGQLTQDMETIRINLGKIDIGSLGTAKTPNGADGADIDLHKVEINETKKTTDTKTSDTDPPADMTGDEKMAYDKMTADEKTAFKKMMADKKTKDKGMTGDAATVADLQAEFALTMSRAEILSPGIRMMTLDSAAPLAQTKDSLCDFRRKSLKSALTNDSALEVIKVLVPEDTDVMRLTCDQATIMFNGAAELMRMSRRQRSGDRREGEGVMAQSGRMLYSQPKSPPSAAEINAANKKFWASRSAQ